MTRYPPHIDTPRMRPTLLLFRGGPCKGLRDRWLSGDPLNLIRVMPAKGLDTMPITHFLAGSMGPNRVGPAIGAGVFA
jgi:hypothetical protein